MHTVFSKIQTIIKNNPNIDLPYVNIGNFLYLKGDTAKAFEYIEKAVKINPNNHPTLLMLYEYFKKKGDNIKAEKYLKMSEKAKRLINLND